MIVANALDDNLIDGDVLDWINRKCRLRSGCFLRPFQSYAQMQSSGVIVLTLINNLKCPLMIISTDPLGLSRPSSVALPTGC